MDLLRALGDASRFGDDLDALDASMAAFEATAGQASPTAVRELTAHVAGVHWIAARASSVNGRVMQRFTPVPRGAVRLNEAIRAVRLPVAHACARRARDATTSHAHRIAYIPAPPSRVREAEGRSR